MQLPPFFTLHAFATIGSTNLEARRLAEAGSGEGQLVWAEAQEQGVGRRGRSWTSPPGNLYCSVVLRPDCTAAEGARFSFLVAVALQRAIAGVLGADTPVTLKWPNDVLAGGRKIAGILLESKSTQSGHLEWLVIGTGVNVASFPTATDGLSATSLREVGGRISVPALLEKYLICLYDMYKLWQQQGFAPVRAAWLDHAAGMGAPMVARLPNQEYHGIFTGLDETGALILTLASGERKLITAGEVFFGT